MPAPTTASARPITSSLKLPFPTPIGPAPLAVCEGVEDEPVAEASPPVVASLGELLPDVEALEAAAEFVVEATMVGCSVGATPDVPVIVAAEDVSASVPLRTRK